MSQHAQNQQVKSPSTTPKSNPPQPKTNNKLVRLGEPARRLPAVAGGGPGAFARLAEAAASAQAYLNNPKAEKTSTRREPVRLVPDLNELPRPASQERDGASPASSLPQTPPSREVQPGRGEDKVAGSASSRERLEGRGLASTPLLATDPHASAKHQKDAESPASALPEAAVDQPARSAISSSRVTSRRPRAPRASTVRQAKNYLRATASPKFLRSAPNLPRHRRKCAICRHPEREMIEELFVRWHSPQAIANFLRDYEEINWVSIYRHAYALGLDHVRRRNLRHFFENLLDDAINATPTFAGVLGAARALGCVTEDGRWVEPEKRILMTTVIRKEEPSSTTTSTDHESASTTPYVGAALALPAPATQAEGPCGTRREQSRTAQPEHERGTGSQPVHDSGPGPRGTGSQPVHDNLHETATASAASAPPVGSGGSGSPARDSSARWGRSPDLPACAVRAGSREIRLPLNSHKTKHKRISNR